MAQGQGSKKHKSGSAKSELQVPPDYDWRSTDSEEIDRRRQRAREERMRIVNLNPDHPVFSNFQVHSGSGRNYQVEIRDVSSREFACECVDFRSNGLGTCKHVEAVLLWLRRRHREAFRQGTLTGSSRHEIVVDRERGQLRLKALGAGRIPSGLSRWFDPDGTFRGNDPHEAVVACQELAADQPVLRISMEVAPWLELNRRRLESSAARLQRELAMMRMVCDTNFILDPKDRECPKLAEIARILEDSAAEGSKVIVFSEWERMLELVRDHCRDRGLDCAWHTGSVPQQKRRADINRFKEDPQCRVFLSTDAGATGLNLQVASVVVNCDLPWNPARLEQRIARAWRKFQTQAVTVINLISEDTIEHRMLETLATKRSVAEGVLDRPGEITSVVFRKSGKDTADRLRNLTRREGEAAAAPEETSARRRDVPREFAARLKQQFGPQLLSCEECQPVGGGPTRILVVAEHAGQVATPWLKTLRDNFFPGGESPTPWCDVEVIDRATQEAIERMVKAGLLQRVEGVRRDLLAVEVAPPPLTDEERARRDAAATRAERLLRRAQVLGEADFPEEAVASLREALLPMALARALLERWTVPTSEQDLLTQGWISHWGGAYPTVQQVLSGAVSDASSARAILTNWMS